MHECVVSSVCGVSCCAGDWRKHICKSTARLGNLANGLIGAKLCKWGFLWGSCAGTFHQCHAWWACNWKIAGCENGEGCVCGVSSPGTFSGNKLNVETENTTTDSHTLTQCLWWTSPNKRCVLSLKSAELRLEMRIKSESANPLHTPLIQTRWRWDCVNLRISRGVSESLLTSCLETHCL